MESVPSSSLLPRVCVTGGGGFIASWLVKLLLSRGYAVHATVRDPCDPKNAFLKQLDGAPENLRLFKANMLDYDTLTAPFAGCEGVFHVASPVPEGKLVDPEKEMMTPAIEGTRNVLKACSAMNVKKFIQVSSVVAAVYNPGWPQGKVRDESSWSDKEFCMENEIWYALAKTEAEEIALEYGKKNGLQVISLCPGVVFGPLLQHMVLNTTSKVLVYIIKGGPDTMTNKSWPIVDVRDVADALLLLYNKAGSSERYLCSLDLLDMKDLLEILKNMYPNYSYADKIVDADYRIEMTSHRLKNLGWKPRKLEETLADSVESYEEAGFLQVSEPCRLPFLFLVPTVQE
ncbi:cinnamoyl-CoA reductase 1-like [Lolium rigidum]|uniref:cinnamoyl-CoA reductase 1-like n=1 Tax=Lolium rigidum TaxID=89674 RepID=UPI001F5C3FDB|nr:cinnamoyl-CoA reductase 1-like [Lolium rigidum]XP_051200226.1 cinnamoyl-CoA reductase 1-like [Lolium perenne]